MNSALTPIDFCTTAANVPGTPAYPFSNPTLFMLLAHNRKVSMLLTLRKTHLYETVGTSNCILYEAVIDWLKYTTVVGQLDYRFFGIRIHRLYIPYLNLTYPSLPHYSRQICCRSTLPGIHIMHLITPSSFLRASVLCFFTSFSVSLCHVSSPWMLHALLAISLRVKSCSLSDGIKAPPSGSNNAGEAQCTMEDRISFHSSFLSAH